MFVSILHFIILSNLFGRKSYWYCLVHMIKFFTERANYGKKKQQRALFNVSLTPF